EAHHRGDHLRLAAPGVREQRTDRSIDDPRHQRLVIARPTFALIEAARDLAGCERLFEVIASERQEIDAWSRILGRAHGAQDGRVAEVDHHGSVGLLRDVTDGECKRLIAYTNCLLDVWHRSSFFLTRSGARSAVDRGRRWIEQWAERRKA